VLKGLLRLGQTRRVDQVELAQYNLYEARRFLSRLVDRVLDGEEIVIARAGRPLVKLVRYDRRELTRPGLIRAEILIEERREDQDDA
jgi:prevent-host-death family protein